MFQKKKKKALTYEEALGKAMKYCAYQERCTFEIEEKAKEWELTQDETNRLIDFLRNERFIDDFRFACSFVRGKHNYKSWGKILIRKKLKEKKISNTFINEALKEINADTYLLSLKELANKKFIKTEKYELPVRVQKTVYYLQTKGYEINLIWEIINELKAEMP